MTEIVGSHNYSRIMARVVYNMGLRKNYVHGFDNASEDECSKSMNGS